MGETWDMALCMDKYCPLHKKCWRFMVKPTEEIQTYCEFHYNWLARKCDSFIPFDKKTRGKK